MKNTCSLIQRALDHILRNNFDYSTSFSSHRRPSLEYDLDLVGVDG